MHRHVIVALTLASLALPAATATETGTTALPPGTLRAYGAVQAYTDPICGSATDTGVSWRVATGSVGVASWRVVFAFTYQVAPISLIVTTTSYTYFSSGSIPSQTGGGACGNYYACSGVATLQWWDGFAWKTVNSSGAPCVPI